MVLFHKGSHGSELQPSLQQPLPSITMTEKNPRITCTVQGSNVVSHVLSWYRQPTKQGLSFLVSHRDIGKPSYAEGVSERFMPEIDRVTNSFTLLIGNTERKDAGVYYCAIWYANRYIFGEGTEVIFQEGNHEVKAPTVELLGPSVRELHHQRAATFLCRAKSFYPEPIRIKWLIGDLQSVATDEIFSLNKGGDRSFQKVGRFTVPAKVWEEGVAVSCRVEHESGTKELRTKTKENRKWDLKGCEPVPAEGETEGTPHLDQGSTSGNSTLPAPDDLAGTMASVFYVYLGMLSLSVIYTLILATQACKAKSNSCRQRPARKHSGQHAVPFTGKHERGGQRPGPV